MKKILCIFFCLLPILGGKAQTLYKAQVRIEKESITRSEDNNVLTINLDIVLKENLKLESNNVATLTPFLEANGKTKVLSSIVVYGRKRDIVNQRNSREHLYHYTSQTTSGTKNKLSGTNAIRSMDAQCKHETEYRPMWLL